MNEDRNQEPGERMRNIFSSNDDDANAQFQPKSAPELQPESKPQSRSILDQLPKMQPAPQTPAEIDLEKAASQPEPQVSSVALNKLPQKEQLEQPSEKPPVQQLEEQARVVVSSETKDMPRGEKFLRALWTIASVFSMILNIVLIIILVVAFWAYRDIRLPEGFDITIANKLLGGLYSNFEKLDRATIKTVIPVDAQIPLDISVPVQTTTQITLADSVVIPNAQVVINTGGLNINSNARVTLPAGTPLSVNLNFTLPVQTSIPVHLDVPVNIPMTETELHEPFVGLQDVVRPLYCLVDPKASNLDRQLICQ